MYVPFIPVVPHTTVVNKTIVYSDTILNIKEDGLNIQVSCIDNIKESELERCLKIIFEENKNVTFHTIQYSKINNKVYFYTNKEINTNVWNDFKLNTYKPIRSNEILEEIKNIFTQEINTDENFVSLYTISTLTKKVQKQYKLLKDNYQFNLEHKISPSSIIIYDFNYDTNELKIGISFLGEFYEIHFFKENDDVYITKSEYYDNQKVLTVLGNDLSELYDEFMKFKDFKKQHSYGIKTVNSIFNTNVSSYGVTINNDNFELASNSYTPNYRYECNSVNTINAIKGNEEELFKRIFVNIKDLPQWCQSTLYEIRKQELEKEQNKEKQKCKSLKCKFKQFIDRHF